MPDVALQEDQLSRAVRRARERGVLIPTFAEMIDPAKSRRRSRRSSSKSACGISIPSTSSASPGRTSPVARAASSATSTSSSSRRRSPASRRASSAWSASTSPPARTRSARPSAAWCRSSCQGSSTRRRRRRSGPPPATTAAAAPSTATLLGCKAIAILPEGMSRERFDWLDHGRRRDHRHARLRVQRQGDLRQVLGAARRPRRRRRHLQPVRRVRQPPLALPRHRPGRGRGACRPRIARRPAVSPASSLTPGSAGTIAAGDYLKEQLPAVKVVATEALQCPTLLDERLRRPPHRGHRRQARALDPQRAQHRRGHGHRRRGLPAASCGSSTSRRGGCTWAPGVPASLLERLDLIGISGIGNLLSSIKFAKHFELGPRDLVLTVLTDSVEMYRTRLAEMTGARGPYRPSDAERDFHRYLLGQATDNMIELDFPSRKRIHQLKYYTWVEQQGKELEELDRQWNEFPEYWERIHGRVVEIDRQIEEFNARSGVLDTL